ncbi:RM40 protein, partial [Amia calva]|nr:RM40 protein [Amia calva]
MAAISAALDAQKEALQQLRQESEELYQAAVKRDARLFPFNHQGPSYSPPIDNYRSPDGKYNDITKVYTQ